MTVKIALASMILTAAACGDSLPPEEPDARVDLRVALGSTDVDPIAVSVTPDGSQRFVFDRNSGIHEIDANGDATLVMAMDQMPDPGVEVRLPYTDMVALGDNKFAVTAIGDGFLLDTVAQTMSLHFCYEPDFIPEEFVQRTDAVTYDPALDKIIAQPQTFNGDNQVVSSDIGYYDRQSGADETWYPLSLSFAAGGMAVNGAGELFLGSGSTLYRYDRERGAIDDIEELGRFGVSTIDGLGFDHASGDLLVVDAQDDQLLVIGAAQR